MITLRQAILNPKDFFSTPQEVLNNHDFSDKEKKVILRLWAHDERYLKLRQKENISPEDGTRFKDIMGCLEILGS